jgi:NLE (NUC135) domain
MVCSLKGERTPRDIIDVVWGWVSGPQFDVPCGVTPGQLEILLRKFLNVEEAVPYSFFVEDKQAS